MVLWIILGLLALFFAVVLIRTLAFRPKQFLSVSQEEVTFDQEKCVDALAPLVRCRTISYNDPSLEEDS